MPLELVLSEPQEPVNMLSESVYRTVYEGLHYLPESEDHPLVIFSLLCANRDEELATA